MIMENGVVESSGSVRSRMRMAESVIHPLQGLGEELFEVPWTSIRMGVRDM